MSELVGDRAREMEDDPGYEAPSQPEEKGKEKSSSEQIKEIREALGYIGGETHEELMAGLRDLLKKANKNG